MDCGDKEPPPDIYLGHVPFVCTAAESCRTSDPFPASVLKLWFSNEQLKLSRRRLKGKRRSSFRSRRSAGVIHCGRYWLGYSTALAVLRVRLIAPKMSGFWTHTVCRTFCLNHSLLSGSTRFLLEGRHLMVLGNLQVCVEPSQNDQKSLAVSFCFCK